MKNMKRIAAIILAIALAAMFVGCGIAKNEGGNGGGAVVTPKPEEKTLEGTYYADVDISDIVATQIADEYDIDASAPLLMNLSLTLKSNNMYEMAFDVEKFFANTEDYYYQIFPALIKSIFADQGIPESDIESTLKGLGYDSLQAYLDEMVVQAMDEVHSQYSSSDASFISEGSYKVDGDKIELFDGGVSTPTDSGVINSDGTITIEDVPVEGGLMDVTFSK